MEISDILLENMIVSNLEADNKRQILEKVAQYISKQKSLDKSSVFEAIWERENLGSTGYGNGVAFPHARMSDINKVVAAFFRLERKVSYDAIDGIDVDLVACVISPENRGEDHLQALALFSRALKQNQICDKIRSANSAKEIYRILKQA